MSCTHEHFFITCLSYSSACLQVNEASERIDLERLKVREKIHFFGDIMLYEDELADNGRSVLSVKIVSVFS